MQINRTGYALLAVFGLGGVGFCVAAYLTGLYWELGLIGVMWVIGTLIAIWIAIRQRLTLRRDIRLWKTGLRGRATIVEGRSGAQINSQPLVALTVDLDFPGHEPRRYTKKMVINTFAVHHMKPGMVLPAYVDPARPDEVLIVW
jgi:hypothetical protein